MAQPQRGLQMASPLAIVFAKLGVPVAVGMRFAVFDPQQAQRDAFAPQSVWTSAQSGAGMIRPCVGAGGRKQAGPQLVFAQVGGKWPTQPGGAGALDVFTHRGW